MVDLSFIGKGGVIIQFEDVISMTGFNAVRYLRDNNINNEELIRMSIEDILMKYINRVDEDISEWIKKMFNIDFDINQYTESIQLFQPNFLYAYRLLGTAYKNGITNLIIHSDIKSDIIKKFTETFEVPVKYTYGDIVPVLKDNINVTYITASPKNIKKCLDVDSPFALTIVDDFLYVGDIIMNKIDKQLTEQNKIVRYTSIISAGTI